MPPLLAVLRLAVVVACSFASVRLNSLTLEDLLEDPKLTPKKFASYFENFEYEYGEQVQTAEAFLQLQCGDCDDYAVLADHVLRQKGFGTRLIHVRMMGRVAHAVCYVTQSSAYLDYNNRKFAFNLQRCGPTLRKIAEKVADSFEANWTSVSEFTYEYKENKKHFGLTVVKTDPPSKDPDSARK